MDFQKPYFKSHSTDNKSQRKENSGKFAAPQRNNGKDINSNNPSRAGKAAFVRDKLFA